MSIKYYLARLVEKITGKKCSRCRHNCGGRCVHPSDGMYMRCWHGITRPGFEYSPSVEYYNYAAAAVAGLVAGLEAGLEAGMEPGDMTPEEKYQLAQIVTTLQEASATARDGGLLED